jgi:hypothetical protein
LTPLPSKDALTPDEADMAEKAWKKGLEDYDEGRKAAHPGTLDQALKKAKLFGAADFENLQGERLNAIHDLVLPMVESSLRQNLVKLGFIEGEPVNGLLETVE